jgi:hypothetical protein
MSQSWLAFNPSRNILFFTTNQATMHISLTRCATRLTLFFHWPVLSYIGTKQNSDYGRGEGAMKNYRVIHIKMLRSTMNHKYNEATLPYEGKLAHHLITVTILLNV